MYVSAKELHAAMTGNNTSYSTRLLTATTASDRVSLAATAKLLRNVKQAIENRELYYVKSPGRRIYLGKWLRPWDVVPKLANFSAPEGDFGVGIEVEYGFASLEAACTIASKISRWEYITLDYEGGPNPIEVTFPPVLYSKLSKKTQAVRYAELLKENRGLLYNHSSASNVGVHVNVSAPASRTLSLDRITMLNTLLRTLPATEKVRYFGRTPYGYGYNRQTTRGRTFVEWKLFNSVACPGTLKRYINIAVALTDLLYSNTPLPDSAPVLAALEWGYNTKKRGKWKSLYTNGNNAAN